MASESASSDELLRVAAVIRNGQQHSPSPSPSPSPLVVPSPLLPPPPAPPSPSASLDVRGRCGYCTGEAVTGIGGKGRAEGGSRGGGRKGRESRGGCGSSASSNCSSVNNSDIDSSDVNSSTIDSSAFIRSTSRRSMIIESGATRSSGAVGSYSGSSSSASSSASADTCVVPTIASSIVKERAGRSPGGSNAEAACSESVAQKRPYSRPRNGRCGSGRRGSSRRESPMSRQQTPTAVRPTECRQWAGGSLAESDRKGGGLESGDEICRPQPRPQLQRRRAWRRAQPACSVSSSWLSYLASIALLAIAAAVTSGGIVSLPATAAAQGLGPQTDVLVALKQEWGTAFPAAASWTAGAECSSLVGVTCDEHNQFILRLVLDSQGISGSIPEVITGLSFLRVLSVWDNELTGPLPSFISAFASLSELNLGSNQLTGSLPATLSVLTLLQTMDMSGNQLEGPVPSELTALTALQDLRLQSNRLTSSLPVELSKLTALSNLMLDSNFFSGSLPESWTELTLLQELHASRNWLSGSVPSSWTALSRLSVLDLGYNMLSGSLFGFNFRSIPSLAHLLLNGNSLEGPLPTQFLSLKTIALGGNAFTGDFPESYSIASLQHLNISHNLLGSVLPASLSTFQSLRVLDISGNTFFGQFPILPAMLEHLDIGNNMMFGPIPPSITTLKQLSFLSADSCGLHNSDVALLPAITSLKHLSLNGNSAISSLPDALTKLTALTALHVCNVSISGAFPTGATSTLSKLAHLSLCGNILGPGLPSELAKLKELTAINVADNRFTGIVPGTLFSLPLLQYIDLNGNGFVGLALPAGANLAPLKTLKLGSNKLSAIPPFVSSLAALQHLDVSNNSLSGPLPPIVTTLATLQHLDLSRNSLAGEFPMTLSSLSSLEHLDLSRNKFEGMLPTLTDLSLLTTVNLGFNSFFGPVITALGSISNLQEINLQSNSLQGQLDPGFSDFTVLKTLVLSDNSIQGALPTGYYQIASLQHLDMSSNQFSGSLPNVWKSLASLKTLNLSRNGLTGSVPDQWSDLSSLTALDLSYNNLEGDLTTFIVEALTYLAHLRLNDNTFKGPMPTHFTVLSRLNTVSLSNNAFFGDISGFFGRFPMLTYGNLSHNQLFGQLSEEFAGARALQVLDMSHNMIGGDLNFMNVLSASTIKYLDLSYNEIAGQMPWQLSLLTVLEHLDISGNTIELFGSDKAGYLPPTITALSSLSFIALGTSTLQDVLLFPSFTKLKHLSLSGSGISSLPGQLTRLTALTSLDASGIGLTGPFPPAVTSFSLLVHLNLSSNNLEGAIPDKLASLRFLKTLSLENNVLQGNIPGKLLALPLLQSLIMRNNSLTGVTSPGPIPTPSLQILDLGYNKLTAIPDSVFDLTTLQHLYLNGNLISGTIPMDLSALVTLSTLWLNNNHLSGTISPFFLTLGNLVTLNLARNLLTGEISENLFETRGTAISRSRAGHAATEGDGRPLQLQSLYLNDNFLNGSIPSSINRLRQLDDLQLQNNRLTGPIDSVATLNNLRSLQVANNDLSGTIPATIGGMLQLEILDMSGNRLSGEIPEDFTGLIKLTVLNLRENQLTGRLPDPPPNIRQYQLDKNYFTQGLSSPPNCSAVISFRGNCLSLSEPAIACPGDKQQPPEVCSSFCGLSATEPPCNGHGECLLEGPSKVPVCKCDVGFKVGEYRGSCVPLVGGSTLIALEPVAVPSALTPYGDAIVGAVNKSFTLTPAEAGTSGAVFLSARVPLFSYQLVADSCGRELAFSSSFAFTLARPASSPSGSDGFAFVVAFDATPPAEAVAGGMGYAGMGGRSVAVEFDTWQDEGNKDLDGNHVGINTGGNAMSVVTAAAPTPLNDGTPKYAWIDYDPSAAAAAAAPAAAAASLRVFLSSKPSPRPTKPVLSARLSLCGILQPSSSEYTFAVGFTAASGTQAQSHVISSWSFATRFPQQPSKRGGLPLGLRVSEAAISPSGMNTLFRYASAGILPQEGGDGRDQYEVHPTSTWIRDDLFWPVKQQTACGDCWAYAVVGAIEAAYSIMANLSVAPPLSAPQLRASMRADCQGGSPSQAFSFLLNSSRGRKGAERGSSPKDDARRNALAIGVAAKQRQERSPLCMAPLIPLLKLLGITCNSKGVTKALTGDLHISGFESTAFYGWLGLLLAVQRQPVVVHIEATAASFKDYDGLSKYQDPACFTYNLNHVVLLVGYRLVGKDTRFPNMAPPYWIIRNSWGAEWGDGGHMRMDIQGGDGVCGINSLPGLYPIVRATKDPCNIAARRDALGSLFNPCGKFTCEVDGDTNRCHCNDSRFIEATNADGSRTCAYIDACKVAYRNPCGPGTCVNDGAGSYSCVCPPGFRQGTTVDGTLSCAPGDTRSRFTVTAPNIFCSDIYSLYGLSLGQFHLQNPSVVDCTSPLPIGTVLVLNPPPSLAPCSVFYTTTEGDTCLSVAQYFDLADHCSFDVPCEAAFQLLNPGVDCSLEDGLQPDQAVCVERSVEAAGLIPVCSQYYLVQSGETCEAIRNVPNPPLSPVDFFRLNPGIKCNRLIPETGLDISTGFEACIQASDRYTAGTCPKTKGYVASASDRCSFIQLKYFKGIRGCYKRINGYDCLDKIPTGSRICLPDQGRIRQGICTV
ncbi:hypothetical protein CLOP_g3288 [Closterium sp. NIES-67]|nr:hypothetical protein CLOP_g3288 [Closterium sp. NIES-67]